MPKSILLQYQAQFVTVVGQEYTDGRLTSSKAYRTAKAFLSEGHTAWDCFLSNASSSVSPFAHICNAITTATAKLAHPALRPTKPCSKACKSNQIAAVKHQVCSQLAQLLLSSQAERLALILHIAPTALP